MTNCKICCAELTIANQHPSYQRINKKICKSCSSQLGKQFRAANETRMKTYDQKRNEAAKIRILSHYGNNCAACNYSDIRALSIDHINGGGTKHRESLGIFGSSFYKYLIKNNFPEGYQTLCMNCQFIKKIENRENYTNERSLQ